MGESVGLGVVGLMVRVDWNGEIRTEQFGVQLETNLECLATIKSFDNLTHKASDYGATPDHAPRDWLGSIRHGRTVLEQRRHEAKLTLRYLTPIMFVMVSC